MLKQLQDVLKVKVKKDTDCILLQTMIHYYITGFLSFVSSSDLTLPEILSYFCVQTHLILLGVICYV